MNLFRGLQGVRLVLICVLGVWLYGCDDGGPSKSAAEKVQEATAEADRMSAFYKACDTHGGATSVYVSSGKYSHGETTLTCKDTAIYSSITFKVPSK